MFAAAKSRQIRDYEAVLSAFIKEIEIFWNESNESVDSEIPSDLTIILRILNRFHKVARRMTFRHDGRETISITDEYDVQDLLHALLVGHFDDVRAEEWTPSYGGNSSRMDFLVKGNDIVIEVKKTRTNLKDKELVAQLNDDIARYAKHPNCKTLICFVYDPEEILRNPTAIENDLKKEGDLNIQVIVRPIR